MPGSRALVLLFVPVLAAAAAGSRATGLKGRRWSLRARSMTPWKTVRGAAAEAIGRLLYARPERADQLFDAVRALVATR
jgi:hypothetical protein